LIGPCSGDADLLPLARYFFSGVFTVRRRVLDFRVDDSASDGATGWSARTTSSVKLVSGKKLASARRNRTAGNRARKR
jgi:hypothetical protein